MVFTYPSRTRSQTPHVQGFQDQFKVEFDRSASIIPAGLICRLNIPFTPSNLGPVTPREWNTFTVLDKCQTFYINAFTNVQSYMTFLRR